MGKNPGSECALAHVLKKRGVAGPAEILKVDPARLLRREDLALHGLAVYPEGEFLDHRASGEGKDVSPLHGEAPVIAKGLVHRRGGYAILNCYRDVVIDDSEPAQRRTGNFRPWDGDDNAIGKNRENECQKNPQTAQNSAHNLTSRQNIYSGGLPSVSPVSWIALPF
jgi:hypothetical protein